MLIVEFYGVSTVQYGEQRIVAMEFMSERHCVS